MIHRDCYNCSSMPHQQQSRAYTYDLATLALTRLCHAPPDQACDHKWGSRAGGAHGRRYCWCLARSRRHTAGLQARPARRTWWRPGRSWCIRLGKLRPHLHCSHSVTSESITIEQPDETSSATRKSEVGGVSCSLHLLEAPCATTAQTGKTQDVEHTRDAPAPQLSKY